MILKKSGSNNETKIEVIRANVHKYSVSKICKVLSISRSAYYSFKENVLQVDSLTGTIIKLFNENLQACGTRKLKVELAKLNHHLSRRCIASIMKSNDLVSSYTMKKYTPPKDTANEEKVADFVDREFDETNFGIYCMKKTTSSTGGSKEL